MLASHPVSQRLRMKPRLSGGVPVWVNSTVAIPGVGQTQNVTIPTVGAPTAPMPITFIRPGNMLSIPAIWFSVDGIITSNSTGTTVTAAMTVTFKMQFTGLNISGAGITTSKSLTWTNSWSTTSYESAILTISSTGTGISGGLTAWKLVGTDINAVGIPWRRGDSISALRTFTYVILGNSCDVDMKLRLSAKPKLNDVIETQY